MDITKMNEEKDLYEAVRPKALLKAMNKDAEMAIQGDCNMEGFIVISKFPFRIGREYRTEVINEETIIKVRHKKNDVKRNNDLYLIDNGERLHISREHLQIERSGDHYFVTDRNSTCGVGINQKRIGKGMEEHSMELNSGDIIKIGTEHTPYVYKFVAFG
jgi:pSer/pThr/pTyr-binding forkhead associated (FHA) protein